MARSDWPSVRRWAGVLILRLVPALANSLPEVAYEARVPIAHNGLGEAVKSDDTVEEDVGELLGCDGLW